MSLLSKWEDTINRSSQVLISSDIATGDNFGISTDSDNLQKYVVIGADSKNSNAGAIYVFHQDQNSYIWSQQTKLTPTSSSSNDLFGHQVNISGNGEYIVSGCGGTTNTHANSQVVIFKRNNKTWTQQASISPPGGGNAEYFGMETDIDDLGETLIASRYNHTSGQGKLYVFNRNGNSWSLIDTLTSADIANSDNFGRTNSISGDGNWISASADQKNTGASASGGVYLFKKNNGTWSQFTKISPRNVETNLNFGRSHMLNMDGTYLAIGAYNEDANGTDSGAVYIYKNNGTWSEQSRIVGSAIGANDNFGRSISIDVNGRLVSVGAPGDDTNGDNNGIAYFIRRNDNEWSEIAVYQPTINQEYAYTTNLNIWYIPSEGTGTSVAAHTFKSTTYGSTGTLDGASWESDFPSASVFNDSFDTSLSFDKTGRLYAGTTFNPVNAFTFSCWLYIISSGNTTGNRLLKTTISTSNHIWQAGNFSITVGYNSPNFHYEIGQNGGFGHNDDNHPQAEVDIWQHFTLTYNGSGTFKFYINGVYQASRNVTTISANQELYFGGDDYYSSGLNGYMTDIRLYTSELDPDAVADVYQANGIGLGSAYQGGLGGYGNLLALGAPNAHAGDFNGGAVYLMNCPSSEYSSGGDPYLMPIRNKGKIIKLKDIHAGYFRYFATQQDNEKLIVNVMSWIPTFILPDEKEKYHSEVKDFVSEDHSYLRYVMFIYQKSKENKIKTEKILIDLENLQVMDYKTLNFGKKLYNCNVPVDEKNEYLQCKNIKVSSIYCQKKVTVMEYVGNNVPERKVTVSLDNDTIEFKVGIVCDQPLFRNYLHLTNTNKYLTGSYSGLMIDYNSHLHISHILDTKY